MGMLVQVSALHCVQRRRKELMVWGKHLIINHPLKPPPVLLPQEISMGYANLSCQKAPGQRFGSCCHPQPPFVTAAPSRTVFAHKEYEAFNNSHLESRREKKLFHYGNIIGLAPFHAGEQLPEAAGDPRAAGAAG